MGAQTWFTPRRPLFFWVRPALTHPVQPQGRCPAQLLMGQAGVGITGSHIAFPSCHHLVRDLQRGGRQSLAELTLGPAHPLLVSATHRYPGPGVRQAETGVGACAGQASGKGLAFCG